MTTNKEAFSRFQNFMRGFSAAVQLRSRAAKNGSFIEYVCLCTSFLDGLLRIGLILKHQLDTSSSDILEELLYQPNDQDSMTERTIYQRALQEGIIDQSLFVELNTLHDKRNIIVHKYIISGITTDQILEVGVQYRKALDSVKRRIRDIEDQQIRRGVGIAHVSRDSPDAVYLKAEQQINQVADDEHG
jgi:uncharacterized protein YutE (UPF0331/DUF86 family)